MHVSITLILKATKHDDSKAGLGILKNNFLYIEWSRNDCYEYMCGHTHTLNIYFNLKPPPHLALYIKEMIKARTLQIYSIV